MPASQEKERSKTAKVALSKAPAYDALKRPIGFRYQVTVPEELCGIEGGRKETIYESYLLGNPMDEAFHDAEASKQYHRIVADIQHKVAIRAGAAGANDEGE